MLFSLRLMALSLASIATSLLVDEPVVLDDPVVAGNPDEFAVPALLVPDGGGEATFAGLPAPLGSLPELLRPPALAGPDGTPLTPAVPAPAEPALGEPTALPLPDEGPLAAPPAFWANELTENIKKVIAASATAADADALIIANSLLGIQRQQLPQVPGWESLAGKPCGCNAGGFVPWNDTRAIRLMTPGTFFVRRT
jgi:hypothetical protein